MSDGFRRFLPGLALAVFSLACGQSPGTKATPAADAESEPPPDAKAPVTARPDLGADRAEPPAPQPDAGAASDLAAAAPDLGAMPTPDAAAAPAAVLIFTRATGYVHASKGAAAMAVKKALMPLGVTATISEDPALFTPEKLAPFGAVILIDSTDRPFGDPGTPAIEALVAFVRGGRGLVGVHAASSAYENTPAFVGLVGGHFKEHPGGVRLGRCAPEGGHPSAVKLPATFTLVDEFYVFDSYRNDNLVDLRCDALGSPTKLPIAWHRAEGAGRVFYSALGHSADEFEDKRILDDHLIPGVMWALGSPP
jgi:type 1 glutamine amidotransferase